jgi:uncharacterized membrane protein YhiD involved in acid resistance
LNSENINLNRAHWKNHKVEIFSGAALSLGGIVLGVTTSPFAILTLAVSALGLALLGHAAFQIRREKNQAARETEAAAVREAENLLNTKEQAEARIKQLTSANKATVDDIKIQTAEQGLKSAQTALEKAGKDLEKIKQLLKSSRETVKAAENRVTLAQKTVDLCSQKLKGLKNKTKIVVT